jgi:hypothetical protein
MNRVESILLLVLVIAVTGLGVVQFRADQRAREAEKELICVERAHATASIALLTPPDRVDESGRIRAIEVLGNQLEEC